jgi:flagellar protein FliL
MALEDDMMEGDDSPGRSKDAPPAKKKGGLILILVGALVLVGAPAGTFLFLKASNADKVEEEAAAKPTPPPIVKPIDALVVNISGTRMTRVLRMQVHLILNEERLSPVIDEMLPMVKDRIMATAGRRTLEELESIDDRESLKRDITLEINSLVRSRMAGSVQDVAFSEFLIQ